MCITVKFLMVQRSGEIKYKGTPEFRNSDWMKKVISFHDAYKTF